MTLSLPFSPSVRSSERLACKITIRCDAEPLSGIRDQVHSDCVFTYRLARRGPMIRRPTEFTFPMQRIAWHFPPLAGSNGTDNRNAPFEFPQSATRFVRALSLNLQFSSPILARKRIKKSLTFRCKAQGK